MSTPDKIGLALAIVLCVFFVWTLVQLALSYWHLRKQSSKESSTF